MNATADPYHEKLQRWKARRAVPPPLPVQPSAPDLTLSFGGDISSIAPESPRDNFALQSSRKPLPKFTFSNEETMSAGAYSERRKASTPVSPRSGNVNESSVYLDCETSHHSPPTSARGKQVFFADDCNKTMTPVFSEASFPEDIPPEFSLLRDLCSTKAQKEPPKEISSPVAGMVRIDDLRSTMFACCSWKKAIRVASVWIFSMEELLHCAANEEEAAAQFEDDCLNQSKLDIIYRLTREYCYCFGGDDWIKARTQSWQQRTTDVLRDQFDNIVTRNQTELRKELKLAPLTSGQPCECKTCLRNRRIAAMRGI